MQLRTRVMHEWAVAVEVLGGRLNQDLKNGRGPQEVLDWLQSVAEALALEEGGHVVGEELIQRIDVLQGAALPYLPGGSRTGGGR